MRDGWQILPFENVISDRSGGNIKTPQSEFLQLGEFPIVDQGKSLISGYTNDSTRVCKVKLPVIIFGDHTRCLKFIDFPFGMGADGVKVLRPSINADEKYLFHYLQNLQLPNHGYDRHFKYLRRTDIVLPPIDQQKRIAAILDKAEELRRLRRQSIEHLDVLSRSIFIEMFGSNSAPKGEWNIVDFGNLIEILTDYHANGSYEILRDNVVLRKQSDYALMVRTTDLENNNFEGDCIYIDEKAYNFLSKSKVHGGEIIINKIGSAGKVYLMPHLQKPVSLGMNAFLIRLNSKANVLFIYYFLTSSYGKAAIDKNVKGAVTKTITKEAIRGIKTPVPPLPLQQEFAQRIETIEYLKTKHRESLAQLDTLFTSLQHRAFRGEL